MHGTRNVSAVIFALCLAGWLFLRGTPALAQDAAYAPMSMEDLDQLAGPVALYPDAILAEVLTAATYPDDVIAAAQWLDARNDPAGIDNQPWDLSVKGVARYPDVLHYMAANQDWMNSLGDAFLNQPADVTAAIQSLRAEALADGNLVSNDQQQVVQDGSTIEIIPANPDILYVPTYDSQVVYVDLPHRVGEFLPPLLRFGPGVRVGDWLHHDFDWHDGTVYVGSWGADRPWWHHDPHAGGNFYANNRPGTYHPTNRGNGAVNVGRWQRDARKPAPRLPQRAVARQADQRPGTGYPARQPVNQRQPANEHPVASQRPEERAPAKTTETPAYNRGSVVAQQSMRGQESRQAAGVRATPAPAAPARNEVRPQPAARPAPEARAPEVRTPAPRVEAPSRGAVSNYQAGADASRSSSRGAESRSQAAPAPERRGR
jgi:hypothetical protein